MNYGLFQVSAVKAFDNCRDIKAMVSDMQQVISAVPGMVRKNERLEKEKAELRQENAALKAELDDWKGNAEGFEPDAYMRLPVDADGIAISPGDKIYFNGDPDSEALKCVAVGCSPYPVEFVDWEETGTTAWEEGWAFTHRQPNQETADSWEKLEEDALKTTCDYAHAPRDEDGLTTCKGCRFQESRSCHRDMTCDVLKRAKKLAGIEEQEGE